MALPRSQCSQFPVERPGKTEVGRLRAWRTGFNELKGKLESGLSDNCTRLFSVRKDNQLRIRTGKTIVEARVRAVAYRSQESAGRQGDQPCIRTGTGKAGIRLRVRAERSGARGPPPPREPAK